MEEAPAIIDGINGINNINFNLKSNKGNNYEIIINGNNYHLIISLNELNKERKNKYKCITSIDDIKKTKYFLQFENIKEIMNELQFLIKQNQNLIELNEKENQFDLIFKILNSKNDQIIFRLEEENNLSFINYIILKEHYSKMKDELNELKNKIFNLEKENFELKKNNFELKIDIEKIKQILIKNNQLDDLNNKIENLNSLICNDDDNKLIKSYINSNQKIKAELLYRLTENGNSIQTFHQLCNNKGATLVLYRTQKWNEITRILSFILGYFNRWI